MVPPLSSGEHLDILAISCDSFNEATNRDIGRHQGKIQHLDCLVKIREWCTTYRVAFKINTVVNTHNWEENMSQEIIQLNPVRWKVRNYSYPYNTTFSVATMQTAWSRVCRYCDCSQKVKYIGTIKGNIPPIEYPVKYV